MKDLLLVAEKELREIVGAGGGRRGVVRELLFVGIFGLFFPLSQAAAWRMGAVPAIFVLLIPLFLVGPHVADSFAGERERRTLETLLATRLPDAAIFLGKVLAVCAYAWSVTFLILVASLVTLNATGAGRPPSFPGLPAPDPGPFLYPGFVWAAWAAGSAATSLLLGSIGTFVSLRAKTVRSAAQALTIPVFVVIFGASAGLPVAWRALPGPARARLVGIAETMSPLEFVLGLAASLLVLDALLLWVGVRRFRRDTLIAG
ncbi:MAG: ABC transporter permease [Gemmatimonadota bacterium]